MAVSRSHRRSVVGLYQVGARIIAAAKSCAGVRGRPRRGRGRGRGSGPSRRRRAGPRGRGVASKDGLEPQLGGDGIDRMGVREEAVRADGGRQQRLAEARSVGVRWPGRWPCVVSGWDLTTMGGPVVRAARASRARKGGAGGAGGAERGVIPRLVNQEDVARGGGARAGSWALYFERSVRRSQSIAARARARGSGRPAVRG